MAYIFALETCQLVSIRIIQRFEEVTKKHRYTYDVFVSSDAMYKFEEKKTLDYDFSKYEYCYLDYMKEGITPKKQESYMVDSPIKKSNCILWI